MLACIVSLLLAGAAIAQDDRSAPGEGFTVLTWNVLATPNHVPDRALALIDIIRAHDPDLVCLQEVAPWMLDLLRDDGFFDRYSLPVDAEGRRFAALSGVLIAVRGQAQVLAEERLPGRQNRSYRACDVVIDGHRLSIASSHLESFLEDHAIRIEQLEQIDTAIGDRQPVIVMGDFNFGTGAADALEQSWLTERYHDAWEHLHPDEDGYTWNRASNPMADAGSFPDEESRRIDRICWRGDGIRPLRIDIIGQEAIDEDGAVFPSDHFGLVAHFAWTDAADAAHSE